MGLDSIVVLIWMMETVRLYDFIFWLEYISVTSCTLLNVVTCHDVDRVLLRFCINYFHDIW